MLEKLAEENARIQEAQAKVAEKNNNFFKNCRQKIYLCLKFLINIFPFFLGFFSSIQSVETQMLEKLAEEKACIQEAQAKVA